MASRIRKLSNLRPPARVVVFLRAVPASNAFFGWIDDERPLGALDRSLAPALHAWMPHKLQIAVSRSVSKIECRGRVSRPANLPVTDSPIQRGKSRLLLPGRGTRPLQGRIGGAIMIIYSIACEKRICKTFDIWLSMLYNISATRLDSRGWAPKGPR